jgi:hypothetical protein
MNYIHASHVQDSRPFTYSNALINAVARVFSPLGAPVLTRASRSRCYRRIPSENRIRHNDSVVIIVQRAGIRASRASERNNRSRAARAGKIISIGSIARTGSARAR